MVARRCLLVAAIMVVLGLTTSLGLAADTATREEKQFKALRVDAPITLDGQLDEAVWQQAEPAVEFIQQEPDTGQPASQRTEVRVVYTSRILYVGVMCFDQEPDKIIAKEMQRDASLWRDDAVDILFDTFDDDRNAYLFETNPNGARTDLLITDEGRFVNVEWDGVWEVKAAHTDQGWSAELAIPFSTLRFDPSAVKWGFNVLRYIRRNVEAAFWSPILLDADVKRVSQYGAVTGIEGIEQGWNLNVKPFAVGDWQDSAVATDDASNDTEFDWGLDLKWGVTRGLALDLTYNTDFAETEVDALQVNLTRFSLFFPEKREFFLENAGIFEFGPGYTGSGAPLFKAFFSRRIGISGSGAEVPIEWGARLTGRVGEWSVGLLDVQTDETALADGSTEPSTNWGTFRLTRNLGRRSLLGLVVTQKDEDENTNQTYGVDFNYKPKDELSLDTYWINSDNSMPSGESGYSAGVGATWSGPIWDWNLGWTRVDDHFDPQMGFLLRSAVNRYNGGVTYEPRPAGLNLMNLHFAVSSVYFTDLDGTTETELHQLDLFGLRTKGGDTYILYVVDAFEWLREDFAIVPEVVIPTGEYDYQYAGVSFETDSARNVAFAGQVEAGDFYDGDRLGGSVSLYLRPSKHLRSETTVEYNDISLPDGDFTAQVLRERLQLAITPDLLTNLYLQYNDLAEVVSMNLRFNWIYRPGSDIFVVFNQTWDAPSFSDLSTRDRQVMVKMTYLFQR